jgi:uncharacterized membrane-anchored protein YjiN (DUF445 family)
MIDPREKPLRRMQAMAVGLLLAAIAGLVLSALMGGTGVWAWTLAFCEAAVVGALADWFAVVALFRRPLRLPIPHTAILPEGKDRIADGLAVFVRDHFLDSATLMSRLSVFDPATRLGQWLSQPDNVRQLSASVRTLAIESLGLLDEESVRRTIRDFVISRLRSWDAASMGGEVLGLLTKDGRHHELLDAALSSLAHFLDSPEAKHKVSALMVKHARKEWPMIVTVVDAVKSVEVLADNLADRLAMAIISEMQDILSNPQHAIRLDYETWLQDFVQRLKDDAALIERIQEIKNQIIEHPAVHDYVNGLWDEIFATLSQDLAKEDSAVIRHVEHGLRGLGQAVAADAGLREAINTHVLSAADKLAGTLRTTVTTHISQTIKGWDDQHLVRELELSVGRDLQFIRLNGTVVGGVVGLALHALLIGLAPYLH